MGRFTLVDLLCEKVVNNLEEITTGFAETLSAIDILEEVVCDKFEQTWTILADIDEDIENISEHITVVEEVL